MTPKLPAGDPVLAYRDQDFLDSDDARPLRILTEYLQPLHRFRQERVHDTVVFFGSARIGPDGPMRRYYEEARDLARMLTEWSKTLPGNRRFVVCSGGGSGSFACRSRSAASGSSANENSSRSRRSMTPWRTIASKSMISFQ